MTNDPIQVAESINSVTNNIGDELVDKPFVKVSDTSAGHSPETDNSGRILFTFIENFTDKLCDQFELERVQVYLGLALLSAVVFSIFMIYSSWSHYSPIILSFFEKEQRARRLSEKEKETQTQSQKSRERVGEDVNSQLSEDMDKFKNFLKEKKVNKHFKRSGPGATLGASTDPPSAVLGSAQGGPPSGVDRVLASDIAAQAALKRLYKEEPKVSSSQKKIQMIAQRELEKERGLAMFEKEKTNAQITAEVAKMGISPENQPDIQELEHSDLIKGVYYTCDLLGEDVPMTKKELTNVIEEFLTEQLSDDSQDRVIPAVLLLYSMNKRDVRQLAIEVIGKYLQNIAENPDELKFRRIRLSNKAFQERVQKTKGGRAFLEAVGFRECMQPFKEGDPLESFLVMDDVSARDVVHLVGALEALREGQSVPLKLSRDTKVFFLRENERVPLPKLPDDFYELAASEVKAMQQQMTAQVDRMTQMRTREMRQRDDLQCQRKYKYTLIRIRFPDRYVLQGTFGCHETLFAVRQWVHEYTMNQAVEFTLRDPVSGIDLNADSKTLSDLQLAPAAILHYESKEEVTGLFLKEEHVREAMSFTVM